MLFFAFLMCGFASSIANRTLDPLTLAVSQDLSVPVASAALLASAVALPYALAQPVLGPIGDHFGKARVIKTALWVTFFAVLASAFAPTFIILLMLRAVSGAAGGGIIPVTQAMIGDIYKSADRQVTIARFITSAIIGQMGGAVFAGMLEHWIGWRGVMLVCAAIIFVSATVATRFIPAQEKKSAERFSVATAIANYREILRTPRAWACYGATPLIGGLTFGLLPFVSPILEQQGNGGAREAGFLIAGLGGGTLLVSLTLPLWLRFMTRPQLMMTGAVVGAASLATYATGPHWTVQILLLAGFGYGFFMIQNSVQTEVSMLSSKARGSAYSLHAFSFFTGQFLGPIVYGFQIDHFGIGPALTLNALIFCAAGVTIGTIFARMGPPQPI